MGIHFSSWRFIFSALLAAMIIKGSSSRKMTETYQENSTNDNHILMKTGNKNLHDHSSMIMNPSLNVFFTINDLKIGKTMPIYFPKKDFKTSPHLLSRKETNSIPFSLSKLSYLLEFFSFSKESQQAKDMEYTLKQCEAKSIKGETKSCANSLESMLDFVQNIFGSNTQLKVLTTNYIKKPSKELQNYTIIEKPIEIMAKKSVSCHIMQFPFVVYYCHTSNENENRLFEILLESENGEKVKASAICHMDTSQWDKNHVVFQMLKMKPGSSPVCHFFRADSVIWVPLDS